MNDTIHASDNTAVLTHDKIRMEQLCYLSLRCQYSRHMPAYPSSLDNVKRLGIAIPELYLIRIKERIHIQ
jgi:hypothetical protein